VYVAPPEVKKKQELALYVVKARRVWASADTAKSKTKTIAAIPGNVLPISILIILYSCLSALYGNSLCSYTFTIELDYSDVYRFRRNKQKTANPILALLTENVK
jgi:hypothetical protein